MSTFFKAHKGECNFYRPASPIRILVTIFSISMIVSACSRSGSPGSGMVWELTGLENIAGLHPQVIGNPEIVEDVYGPSVYFNGIGDGLVMPVNPVENLKEFTVEVLFKPSASGGAEQRFVHFQDNDGNRALIETRLVPGGKWYLDTYLHNGEADSGLTLADSTLLYSPDNWYWAALVYNGSVMSHYVNGTKEAEGETEFGPMGAGQTSIGVRLNQVYWFKGQIREIRFHNSAIVAADLQKP